MLDENYKLQYDDLPKDKIRRPRKEMSTTRKVLVILLFILLMILQLLFPESIHYYMQY